MSLNYHSLLKKYILDSNLSLSQLEKKMREKGFNKNKSYLSNLQNGKVEPPSSEVSYALAEITGGDPIRLITVDLISQLPLEEVNNESFVSSLSNQIISMLATILEMNRAPLTKFTLEHLPYNIDCTRLYDSLTYDNLKAMFDDTPPEVFIQYLTAPLIELEKQSLEMDKRFSEMGTNGHDVLNEIKKVSLLDSINKDELNYLTECLNMYRKMNLHPKEE